MAGADGFLVKGAMIDALPFSGSATPIELTSESLAKKTTIINTQGMYGTRQQHKERSRVSRNDIAGTLSTVLSPAVFVYLWPKILGAVASGTTFALAETLPSFAIQIDRITKVFNYAGCYVKRAVIKGTAGGFITVDLEILGTSEAIVASGGGQSLTTPIDPPYVMSDCVLTIGGTAYDMMDFELSIDNKLEARFTNSLAATRIAPNDLLEVTLSLTTPFSSTEYALYDSGITSVAATLVMTNGNYSTTFTLPALQAPTESPTANSKGEFPLKLVYQARMTSTTSCVEVTHDSTP